MTTAVGSPDSTTVKGFKQAMADEYSRESSTKVSNDQSPLIELGFRQRAGGIGMEFLRPTGLAQCGPRGRPEST